MPGQEKDKLRLLINKFFNFRYGGITNSQNNYNELLAQLSENVLQGDY